MNQTNSTECMRFVYVCICTCVKCVSGLRVCSHIIFCNCWWSCLAFPMHLMPCQVKKLHFYKGQYILNEGTCAACEACPIADSCVSVQVKGPQLAPSHMIQGFQREFLDLTWKTQSDVTETDERVCICLLIILQGRIMTRSYWSKRLTSEVHRCFTHSTNTPLSSTCSQISTSPSRPERNSGKCCPGRRWNAEGRVRRLPPPPGPRYTHDSCAPTACLPLQHTHTHTRAAFTKNTSRYSVRQIRPRRSAPVPLVSER